MPIEYNKVIDKSEDYSIVILQTSGDWPEDGEYGLVNNVTSVVEVRTPLLPQALEYLEQLQAGLDARRDMKAEIKDMVDGALTEADKNSRDIH